MSGNWVHHKVEELTDTLMLVSPPKKADAQRSVQDLIDSGHLRQLS